MKNRKFKILVLSLLLLAIIFPSQALAYGLDPSLNLEARTTTYLLGDFESGDIFEDYNIDQPLPIASVSKLMTYLVVKDAIAEGEISIDERVTITLEMEEVGGSHYGLVEGEVLTVGQLLEGLMVVSGNDASYALAVKVSGSEESFVARMNQTAQELGFASGQFYNASGLQQGENQNTMSSRDIFQMSRHIIKNHPEVLDYGDIEVISQPERNFIGYSTIPLIGIMPGVDGLKTGFTEEAGYCLVSTLDVKETLKREDYRLISVVMGTQSMDERRDISQYLLEYGLEAYEERILIDENLPYTNITVNSAQTPNIQVYPGETYQALVRKDRNFTFRDEINQEIKAPLKAGQSVGKLKLMERGEEVKEVDLVVKYDIEEASFFTRLVRAIDNFFTRMISMVMS